MEPSNKNYPTMANNAQFLNDITQAVNKRNNRVSPIETSNYYENLGKKSKHSPDGDHLLNRGEMVDLSVRAGGEDNFAPTQAYMRYKNRELRQVSNDGCLLPDGSIYYPPYSNYLKNIDSRYYSQYPIIFSPQKYTFFPFQRNKSNNPDHSAPNLEDFQNFPPPVTTERPNASNYEVQQTTIRPTTSKYEMDYRGCEMPVKPVSDCPTEIPLQPGERNPNTIPSEVIFTELRSSHHVRDKVAMFEKLSSNL